MNLKTAGFIVALFFIIGVVTGFSMRKPMVTNTPVVSKITVHDTIISVKTDTIKIHVDRVRYFTKIDTIIIKNSPVLSDSLNCVSFPLLLSDSSTISITECSKDPLPKDLKFDAQYIDKRERIRVIESFRVDTVRMQQRIKKTGFTLGPSAGVGVDINNIRQPVYFIGATLTYGLRF